MAVEIISVFNNKGGVGKTTLSFHLAHGLATLGKRVLIVDLDPQCNLTIYGIAVETIHRMWDAETAFIDEPGFADSRKQTTPEQFKQLTEEPRTVHFLLKPAEEGTGDMDAWPPPLRLAQGLDILPGRLTLHLYEEQVARRWSDAFVGNPLALRTMSEIRRLILSYGDRHGYDYAIVDTSPSLGPLNKVALSIVDAFLIPCGPDLFSLYGVRNIGNSLRRWQAEFNTLYQLVPPSKRPFLPQRHVRFLGYTIYNAKLRTGATEWNMPIAHYNYAKQIPGVIADHIPLELSAGIPKEELERPIGLSAVMHTHNTFPSLAQKYNCPMWELPDRQDIDSEEQPTIQMNKSKYYATKAAYQEFARAVIERLQKVKPHAAPGAAA
jgi:cellulose biosynthesis protein BcsQ